MTAAPRAKAEAAELDDVTLARAQRGDAAACRSLVERYQKPVFALLSRLLAPSGRGALVADLAQETFLKGFRALPAWNPSGAARLSTWLLTIATRLAIDELRRRPPETEPLEASRDVAGPARADERVVRAALGIRIQRAIAALAPEYQAAFVLREAHELDYEEIAHALEIDVGTVKSRLSRARAALREALAEDHDD